MLFEKIRRTQKPVFIVLALMFGIGFVFLGVGSGAGGINPLDFLNSSSGTASNINDLSGKVKDNPKDAASWLALAQAYQGDGQTDPALGAYQQYIALRPKDRGALIAAAQLYEQSAQNAAQKGSVYQNELTQLQGAEAGGLTSSKFVTGLKSDVITSLQSPLQTQLQTYQSRVASALAQSVVLWKKLTVLEPTNADYWYAMGNDAANGSDYATTQQAFTKYLKLRPDDPQKAQIENYLKQIAPLVKAQQSQSTSGGTSPTP